MPDSAIHLAIHGRVQGVGYRAWMAGEARRLGLSGWVRNRSDGTVEAAVGGDPDKVAELLSLTRHGPSGAEVSHVDVNPCREELSGRFSIGSSV